jgi:glutathione S-transferase
LHQAGATNPDCPQQRRRIKIRKVCNALRLDLAYHLRILRAPHGTGRINRQSWWIMDRVTLFGLRRSVYTRIVRIALEEKGVDYVLNEVEIFGPDGVPEKHFKRHPFGRIPVLQHGSFVLYETAAITRYVDETFVRPALQPETPIARARMQQIIGVLDSYAYRPMVWGAFVNGVLAAQLGKALEGNGVAQALVDSATCLYALENLAAADGWLVDGGLSLADIHAFPMLRCLALAPEGVSLLAAHGRLYRWYGAMLLRPSVQKTRTEYES